MAGNLETRALVLLALALAALILTPAANGQSPVARSVDSKIEAVVVPANDWCSDVVNLELRGSLAVFQQSPENIQRAIGVARAGITEDCPRAEVLSIRGLDGQTSVFLGFSAKSLNWGIRIIEAQEGVLKMLVGGDDERRLRELAYATARRVMSRTQVQDVRFTSAFDTSKPDHIEWAVGSVAGKLNIVVDRAKDFPEITDFADSLGNSGAQSCVDEGGETVDVVIEEQSPLVWTRGFRCKLQPKSYVQYFFVFTEGPYTNVISLYADDLEGEHGGEALQLAQLIQEVLLKPL